ncbi:OmpL47-type beta-barrel domain-containing protein, partial [Rhodocytophaga aerolata]
IADGKLTIDPIGGVNTKLNYVIIDPASTSPDTTPPVVAVRLTGNLQSAGVYRNEVSISLEASDSGGSGLALVEYRINNGVFTPYTSPVLLKAPGIYSVQARATDGSNNQTLSSVTTFSVIAAGLNNTHMVVENLDKFPANDHLVFSRIQVPWARSGTPYNQNHDSVTVKITNKGTAALVINSLNLSNTVRWKVVQLNTVTFNAATMLPLTINPGASVTATIQFAAVNEDLRVKVLHDTLYIASNDDKSPTKKLMLHGLYQNKGEGSNEPYAREIIDAFGFKSNPGFGKTDNSNLGTNKIANSDEVISSFFVKADAGKPVSVIQMAAYHGCCAQVEYFQWYAKGSTTNTFLTGHNALDGQSLLPRRNNSSTALAEGSFNPTGAFGLKVNQSFSDRTRNAEQKIGMRIWKVRDYNGNIIPNAYIIGHDYIAQPGITNYDYQDNMYYISNVRPETGSVNYAELAATPSAVKFPDVLLGKTASFTINLKSLGLTYGDGSADPAIGIKRLELSGPNLNEFSYTQPASATLAAGASTTVSVSFRPSSRGIK